MLKIGANNFYENWQALKPMGISFFQESETFKGY
jgi:hypothetical protein